MMTRSTPPRSANFAEMPVPAPAPRMICFAATRLRSRRSAASRPMNGIYYPPEQRQHLGAHGFRKRRIVDVRIELDDPNRWRQTPPKCLEQRTIRLGIVKGLPFR